MKATSGKINFFRGKYNRNSSEFASKISLSFVLGYSPGGEAQSSKNGLHCVLNHATAGKHKEGYVVRPSNRNVQPSAEMVQPFDGLSVL